MLPAHCRNFCCEFLFRLHSQLVTLVLTAALEQIAPYTARYHTSMPLQLSLAPAMTILSKGLPMLRREASRVGAFINLESTGPGGPDILFQASG